MESCTVNLLSALEIKLPKISEKEKFFGSDYCNIKVQLLHVCIVAIWKHKSAFPVCTNGKKTSLGNLKTQPLWRSVIWYNEEQILNLPFLH